MDDRSLVTEFVHDGPFTSSWGRPGSNHMSMMTTSQQYATITFLAGLFLAGLFLAALGDFLAALGLATFAGEGAAFAGEGAALAGDAALGVAALAGDLQNNQNH